MRYWIGLLAVAVVTGGVVAQERRPANPLIDALAACLAIKDDAKRLSCTDDAGARLVAAERARDVIVVSRDEVKRTKRSLFGLNLDQNQMFGDAGAAPTERVDDLSTTLLAASPGANGRWSLRLAEGGRWQTTEEWVNADPRAGMAVEIHRAALGSYVLRAKGQRVVRVVRVN